MYLPVNDFLKSMPHVTFIHGIANKPNQQQLRKIWLNALAEDRADDNDGLNLGVNGVSSSMIYWADVLYENPLSDDAFENTQEIQEHDIDPDFDWIKDVEGAEKKLVDDLIEKYSIDLSENEIDPERSNEDTKYLERVPLPWPIKKRVMKWLLKDVHHYLFNYEFSPRPGSSFKVQEEIRKRVIGHLNSIYTDHHVVVAHSMGTVIMYDCLKRVAECPQIDGLFTIGSPLGLDEIQDNLKPEWSREMGYPQKLIGPWINVFDRLDPVAGFDPKISNDYKKNGSRVIEDINEQNFGSWRHDIANYLKMPKLRNALRKTLNL